MIKVCTSTKEEAALLNSVSYICWYIPGNFTSLSCWGMHDAAMSDGSLLESDCSVTESDAFCNGSSPADNGVIANGQPVLTKLVCDSQCGDSDDVYVEHGENDIDLDLAAQLSKVLLHQNEQLQRTNEQTIHEFNQKIEVRFLILILAVHMLTQRRDSVA